MSNLRKNKWLNLFLTITMFSFFLTSCDTSTENDDDPPEIPPESTLIMDYSDFSGPAQLSKSSNSSETLTRDNWNWAALNVAVWNTVLKVTLIIPVAAFRHALNQVPEQQENGSWNWEYDFMVFNVTHHALLNGEIVGDEVVWKMYITKDTYYTDYLWYSGTSKINGSEGTWLLNLNPSDPVPFLDILWHRNVADGTADIKYTNVIPGGQENGGFIFYGITNSMEYDRFYDIYNKGADNHTDIEWNYAMKHGQVKDPNHFQDSTWHQWDTNLDDIE